jgi:hypothetical protein
MKYILLSSAVAFLIIGIHQLMTVGLLASYFFFMLALALVIATRLTVIQANKKVSEKVEQKPLDKQTKKNKK